MIFNSKKKKKNLLEFRSKKIHLMCYDRQLKLFNRERNTIHTIVFVCAAKLDLINKIKIKTERFGPQPDTRRLLW